VDAGNSRRLADESAASVLVAEVDMMECELRAAADNAIRSSELEAMGRRIPFSLRRC
jgi:hypothetical protein